MRAACFLIILLFTLAGCGGYFSREEVKEIPRLQNSFRTGILSYLDDQIEKYPENTDLYIEKARYLKEEGWPNEALPVLNKAIELDSANDEAYSLREAYFLSKGRYKDALRDLEVLENKGNLSEDLRNDKIAALYGRQQLEEFYSLAAGNIDALNTNNKLNFSRFYLSRGDSLMAIRYSYLSFLEDSLSDQSVLQLATLLNQKGFQEKSLSVLESGDSNAPAFDFARAEILLKMEKEDQARQIFKKYYELGDTSALVRLNQQFLSRDLLDSAIYYNDRFMMENDTSVFLLKRQAALYQRKFYWNKALEYLNIILKKDPDNEEALSEVSKVRGKIAYLRNLKARRDSVSAGNSNNP